MGAKICRTRKWVIEAQKRLIAGGKQI